MTKRYSRKKQICIYWNNLFQYIYFFFLSSTNNVHLHYAKLVNGIFIKILQWSVTYYSRIIPEFIEVGTYFKMGERYYWIRNRIEFISKDGIFTKAGQKMVVLDPLLMRKATFLIDMQNMHFISIVLREGLFKVRIAYHLNDYLVNHTFVFGRVISIQKFGVEPAIIQDPHLFSDRALRLLFYKIRVTTYCWCPHQVEKSNLFLKFGQVKNERVCALVRRKLLYRHIVPNFNLKPYCSCFPSPLSARIICFRYISDESVISEPMRKNLTIHL